MSWGWARCRPSGSRASGWRRAWAGLAFAAVYLLAPALNGAILSDFHAVALTSTLFLFAFYFLDARRPWAFLAMIVIALSVKEDIPLLVFMLGAYIFVWRRERWLGAATALLGVVWFVIATRVIQPHFNGLTALALPATHGDFRADP